jgi:hypothetical protein
VIVDHVHSSGAEVKNNCMYMSSPHHMPSWCVRGC